MKKWIEAARLRTLPLALSTILLGSACAHFFMGDLFFSWVTFSLALLTTILLQILSNLANDYGDFSKGTDNADRVGPVRTMQAGLIAKAEMKRALLLLILLTLVSGVLLLWSAFESFNWQFLCWFALGIAAISAAIKYTVGKKAYGYSGLGDLFVFIFFGIIGVFGSYFLLHQEISLIIFLPAASIGLLSTAVLNLNNMRDHINDKKSGKQTLVVKIGLRNAQIYHSLLFGLTYVFLFLFIATTLKEQVFYIELLPFIIFHAYHVRKVLNTYIPAEFDPFLKQIAISTFLLSLTFSITLFLI